MTDLPRPFLRLEQTTSFQRRMKVMRVQFWLWNHLVWPKLPILNLVWSFWIGIMDEGIVATCKPRWGGLTFGYLNDGFKPTLWHTWLMLTTDGSHPLNGIYPKGAPRNRKEAEEYR